MNSKSFEILEKFVPKSYAQQASQANATLENEIRVLLEKVKRRICEDSESAPTISHFCTIRYRVKCQKMAGQTHASSYC